MSTLCCKNHVQLSGEVAFVAPPYPCQSGTLLRFWLDTGNDAGAFHKVVYFRRAHEPVLPPALGDTVEVIGRLTYRDNKQAKREAQVRAHLLFVVARAAPGFVPASNQRPGLPASCTS